QRLAEWRVAFAGGDRRPSARLSATDRGDCLEIHDTRPIATDETFIVDGLDRAILRACEGARSPAGLVDCLRAEGHDDPVERIAARVGVLKRRFLVLDRGGSILSLHVNEPVTPYLPQSSLAGLVHVAALLKQPHP